MGVKSVINVGLLSIFDEQAGQKRRVGSSPTTGTSLHSQRSKSEGRRTVVKRRRALEITLDHRRSELRLGKPTWLGLSELWLASQLLPRQHRHLRIEQP